MNTIITFIKFFDCCGIMSCSESCANCFEETEEGCCNSCNSCGDRYCEGAYRDIQHLCLFGEV